jgi:protein involved in polysaccharide export with SLBB domain
LITPGQPPQPLPADSGLLPRGQIDYRVAPLDTLQVEVNPVPGGGVRIDYGSEIRLTAGFTGQNYLVSPGDALSIEINAETDTVSQVAVRPDGMITLPHLSRDIRAAGRTLTDLGAEVAAQYAATMKSPHVTVAVVNSAADPLGRISGSYQVGLDGNLVVPGLGSFPAVGKTPDQLAAEIGGAASGRFSNPVRVFASIGQLTGREVDPRIDPNGRMYFRGPVKVSPDGSIDIQPAGQVTVTGLSLDEVRHAALARLQPLYVNRIQVGVSIADAPSMSVFVGGEVHIPGRYAFSNSMTMLKVLAQSGWVTDVGDLDGVLLLHPSGLAHYTVYRANLNEVLNHGAVGQDLALAPQDIVVVPMTSIGKVDEAIDQYIRKILPFNTAVTYSYITNPVANGVVNPTATK